MVSWAEGREAHPRCGSAPLYSSIVHRGVLSACGGRCGRFGSFGGTRVEACGSVGMGGLGVGDEMRWDEM